MQPMINTKTGKPVDGGGHEQSQWPKAERQAKHMNDWLDKQSIEAGGIG